MGASQSKLLRDGWRQPRSDSRRVRPNGSAFEIRSKVCWCFDGLISQTIFVLGIATNLSNKSLLPTDTTDV